MAIALLITTGVLLLAFVIGLFFGVEYMIRPVRRELEPRHRELLAEPSRFGMKLEPFEVKVSGGLVLKAFLAEPIPEAEMGASERTRRMLERLKKAGVPEVKEKRGTVYFLHGRGGLKENMLTIAQRFVAANYRCIVYDARAHGESEGKFTTFGFLETSDLAQVIDRTDELLTGRGESAGQRIGFGISLGAATLLQALEKEERLELGIAVAPFADLREQIGFSSRKMSYQKLPNWVVELVVQIGGARAKFDARGISPIVSAGKVEVPVFLVHGEKDGVIPVDHSHRIFEKLAHPAKEWREIPDAYHGNVLAEGGDDLYQEMVEFCLRHRKKSQVYSF